MVQLLRVLRVALVIAIAAVSFLIWLELSGRVIHDNFRIARAVVQHADNSTQVARQDLCDATVASQRRRIIEFALLASLLMCLSAGVVFITRSIRLGTI